MEHGERVLAAGEPEQHAVALLDHAKVVQSLVQGFENLSGGLGEPLGPALGPRGIEVVRISNGRDRGGYPSLWLWLGLGLELDDLLGSLRSGVSVLLVRPGAVRDKRRRFLRAGRLHVAVLVRAVHDAQRRGALLYQTPADVLGPLRDAQRMLAARRAAAARDGVCEPLS